MTAVDEDGDDDNNQLLENLIPDEHVDGGNAHVSVDGLPRLDKPVELTIGQRAVLTDLQLSLKITASYFVGGVVTAPLTVEVRCTRRAC